MMYQVEYDGKILAPILEADEAIYWAERIGKLIPRRSTQIVPAEEQANEDWLTENLPPTNPPASTRPGAEYGVDV